MPTLHVTAAMACVPRGVVERAEIFAILGPNGAGKTATLEILEGFRRRDAGSVEVLGIDPADRGQAPRCMSGSGWCCRTSPTSPI
jgi:ABC-type Na+ transport system ATPase subunit NatA